MTDELTAPIVCPICGRDFTTSGGLKRHQKWVGHSEQAALESVATETQAAKPKRGRTPKSQAKVDAPVTAAPITLEQLEDKLTEGFTWVGMGVMALEPYDGHVLILQARPHAQALIAVARANPEFAASLQRIVKGSVWFSVVSVLLQTAAPIAAHHVPAIPTQVLVAGGIWPKGLPVPGSPPPPQPSQVVDIPVGPAPDQEL